MITRQTEAVGHSGWTGGKSERSTCPVPSQEGKDAYEVQGKDLVKPYTILIFPHQLKAKVEKYAAMGQWLRNVKTGEVFKAGAKLPVVAAPPKPAKPSKMAAHKKAVICTTTGVRYDSMVEAGIAHGMTYTGISYLCRQGVPSKKGFSFKFDKG